MNLSYPPYAVSVVILFQNHEQHLADCLNSIYSISLAIEIILINVGSTDKSAVIAESYQRTHDRIFLQKEIYTGMAVGRNAGIKAASGEYIIFLEGDDKIDSGVLGQAYDVAKENQVDMVWGNTDAQNLPRISEAPYRLGSKILSGSECFMSLLTRNLCVPSVCRSMYKRSWLNKYQLYFDENSLYPDELWGQSTLGSASRVLSNFPSYYQPATKPKIIQDVDREGPAVAKDYLRTADLMMESAEKQKIQKHEDFIKKNWTCLNALRLYLYAFRIVTAIRTHTVFELPVHRLHTFLKIKKDIFPDILTRCQRYYSRAKSFEQEYLTWLTNPCDPIIAKMSDIELDKKKIILIYNGPAWQNYAETLKNLPSNYVITQDRKYKNRAYAIVFYMPGLHEHIYEDLSKPDHQIWVRWNMEPETKFSWMLDSTLEDIFDLRMDYHSYADVVCPYYAGFKMDAVARNIDPLSQKNKICMVISSSVNQSKREQYLSELMQYTQVDSYGRLFNNAKIPGEDKGWESKIALYSQYKFVIAFENSILEDYVTEKLYDPLLAGAVPIYLGAPNVTEYTPANNCIINAADFSSAQALADYINRCYTDDQEYLKYHTWRNAPWKETFVEKVNIQDQSPFIRLCQVLDQL